MNQWTSRKYLKAKARQIVMGYRARWAIEIFHKEVKMFLGFEDVATKCFDSVIAHVHWVYCVHILLDAGPFESRVRAISEKQEKVSKIISSRENRRVIQMLTQFDGPQHYRRQLQQAFVHM